MTKDHDGQNPDKGMGDTRGRVVEDAVEVHDDKRLLLLSGERFMHRPPPRQRPSAIVVPLRPR